MMKIKPAALVFACLLMAACVPTGYEQSAKPARPDYSSLYNPASANIMPRVRCYHSSDNESYLFFAVNLNRMMPSPKTENSEGGEIVLGVKYAIRHAETREIIDSASMTYSFDEDERKLFLTYIPAGLPAGNNYFASMLFFDENKKSYKRVVFDIDKNHNANESWFFPEYLEPELQPVLENYLSTDRHIRISSDQIIQDSLYLSLYKNDSVLPAPPYKSGAEVFVSDTAAMRIKYHQDDSLLPDISGFYFISTDSLAENGLGLFAGKGFFPWVRRPEDMAGPIKYIATGSQYRQVIGAENQKAAVDKFWLDIGNSQDNARELIRVYYNRVQLANQYYTATRPGWQTDRGMIYIILGAPQKVHKDNSREEWIYGQSEEYKGLVFRFVKDTASLSDNEFLLMRDVRYKEAWLDAVKSWRNGLPYAVPD